MPLPSRLRHSDRHWHTLNKSPWMNCFKVRQFWWFGVCSSGFEVLVALAELLHVLKKVTRFKQERTCVKIMKASDLRMSL